jgi:hypothetical protein
MTVKKPPVEPFQPNTLAAAHEFMPRVMPAPTAPLTEWLTFRRRSAATYARVADVDRGHHHEALYWAEQELKIVEELKEQIKAQSAKAAKEGGGI